MTEIIINVEQKKKESVHKVGNIYQYTDDWGEKDLYILSRVYNESIVLVSLSNGNRFHNQMEVKDSDKISNEDFRECASDRPEEFMLLSKIEIKGVIE
jgi:hypothetical protein